MKIAITGGSGFIGTNVLNYFKSMSDVINIDCQRPRDASAIKYWKKTDITKKDELIKTFSDYNPDYIIHLAARTDLYGKNLHDYDANITGVRNVLEAASECSNLKKILITSSMLVCRSGYSPKDQFDWTPTTYYGESKVETEKIVWANKPKCDWVILRPTSIWGPWFDVPYRNFFDLVKSGRYFHVGHKSSTKTYGYVGNAVYQIEKILFADTKDENKKVFYLGDNPAIFIENWADEIASLTGRKIMRLPFWIIKAVSLFGDALNFIRIPFPIYSFRLKNMTTNNIINTENTYSVAPNPPYTRKEGTIMTLEWMSKHAN